MARLQEYIDDTMLRDTTSKAPVNHAVSTRGRDVKSSINEYSAIRIFRDAEADELVIENNPYRRPLRANDNRFIDFGVRLGRELISSNSSLAANRMLLNIYESELLQVPPADRHDLWADFGLFYAPVTRLIGEAIRPALENHVFGFLAAECAHVDSWGPHDLQAALTSTFDASPTRALCSAILSMKSKQRQARFYLLQRSAGFLFGNRETRAAHPVARHWTIVGLAEQPRRPMALSPRVLRAAGLRPEPHAYWQFYLPTWLTLNNYAHCLARDPARLLRYIGFLCFAEVDAAASCDAEHALFRELFSARASPETSVFGRARMVWEELVAPVMANFGGEHFGAGASPEAPVFRSARMVWEELVAPVLANYGNEHLTELARGFEEARVLTDIAMKDFVLQATWFDELPRFREHANRVYAKIRSGEMPTPLETFVEPRGERSTTHVHDDDRLLVIEQGSMDFFPALGDAIRFNAGDILLVPRHHLHGSVVRTEECVYHQPLVSREVAAGALG